MPASACVTAGQLAHFMEQEPKQLPAIFDPTAARLIATLARQDELFDNRLTEFIEGVNQRIILAANRGEMEMNESLDELPFASEQTVELALKVFETAGYKAMVHDQRLFWLNWDNSSLKIDG